MTVQTEDAEQRLCIQVETRQRHDDDIEDVLVAHKKLRHAVEFQCPIVVLRKDILEVGLGDGEDRKVLNVGIVLDRIRDSVVSVVRFFPPPNSNASEEIRDGVAQRQVKTSDMRQTVVTAVVAKTCHLLPEHGQ